MLPQDADQLQVEAVVVLRGRVDLLFLAHVVVDVAQFDDVARRGAFDQPVDRADLDQFAEGLGVEIGLPVQLQRVERIEVEHRVHAGRSVITAPTLGRTSTTP